MRYKMTFAVGFAAGYTLGSKAGRERYEQISRAAHSFAENPAVQSAAGIVTARAAGLLSTARRTVVDKVTGSDPYGPGPVPVRHRSPDGATATP